MSNDNFVAKSEITITHAAKSTQTWKRRMIDWIGSLMTEKGFGVPTQFEGTYPGPSNTGDLLLSRLIHPINRLSDAAEAVRKGNLGGYKQALMLAKNHIESQYHSADVYFAKLTEPARMTNLEALDGKLVLVVSEITEMSDAARDLDHAGFVEEHADVEIRMNHLAFGMKTDVEARVEAKMAKNAGRPALHGKITTL
jgi:hypothetical protein